MANITLLGASYTDVPAVDLPKTGGGTVRFYENGGTPSQTQHTLYWEYSDNTSETETAYWDGTFISDAIRATVPTTHNNKTVTLAELDGVAWYEPSAIPLNTQLINFSALNVGYQVADNGSLEASQWLSCSDYTPVDPSMTFSFACKTWANGAFYDASYNTLRVFGGNDYGDTSPDDSNTSIGVFNSSNIPATAAYVRMTAEGRNPGTTQLSLIRTA